MPHSTRKKGAFERGFFPKIWPSLDGPKVRKAFSNKSIGKRYSNCAPHFAYLFPIDPHSLDCECHLTGGLAVPVELFLSCQLMLHLPLQASTSIPMLEKHI